MMLILLVVKCPDLRQENVVKQDHSNAITRSHFTKSYNVFSFDSFLNLFLLYIVTYLGLYWFRVCM